MYYLNYFFIFALFGHLLETVMGLICGWNIESGFLYGYWTPVYGLGVIIMIFTSRIIFRKLKLSKFLEILIYLIVVTIILTIIELIGGYLLEFIFHKSYWNYSNHKYHLGKYIALDISCVWGILSVVFIYLIKPWMDKIVNKIPNFVTYIFCVLFIVDLVITLISKAKIF